MAYKWVYLFACISFPPVKVSRRWHGAPWGCIMHHACSWGVGTSLPQTIRAGHRANGKGGNEFSNSYYQVGKVRSWSSGDVSVASNSHRFTKMKVTTEPYHYVYMFNICLLKCRNSLNVSLSIFFFNATQEIFSYHF